MSLAGSNGDIALAIIELALHDVLHAQQAELLHLLQVSNSEEEAELLTHCTGLIEWTI